MSLMLQQDLEAESNPYSGLLPSLLEVCCSRDCDQPNSCVFKLFPLTCVLLLDWEMALDNLAPFLRIESCLETYKWGL